jgi:RNA polymerase sigma factor (TIGR02999 family)
MADAATTTSILQRLGAGDGGAQAELLTLVHAELHRMAQQALRGERPGHTLQATALVHEAWMRLVDARATDWSGRAHFFGAAARAMRRILVDHARARAAAKRGGGLARAALDESLLAYEERSLDLLALDEALERLAVADARAARIVDLRFFAGLEMTEIAEVLLVSVPTVERGWRMARAWLRSELEREGPARPAPPAGPGSPAADLGAGPEST